MTPDRLQGLTREERTSLCREVVEQLSDYLDGSAQEDFCRRVEAMLQGCQPFEAYRDTLAATIEFLATTADEMERVVFRTDS